MKSRIVKNYEYWQGNKKFICNGSIMYDPNNLKKHIFLILLIILPSILFLTIVIFTYKNTLAIIFSSFISIVTISLTIKYYLKISLKNPGYLLRNELYYKTKYTPEDIKKFKKVIRNNIRGYIKNIKLCKVCLIYRPNKTVHCRTCDNCVQEFDHHCNYLGNCIGKENYVNYIKFLICLLIFTLLSFIQSITSFSYLLINKFIITHSNVPQFIFINSFYAHFIISGILVIVSVSIFSFTFPLFKYHYNIIGLGLTTYQQVKQNYLNDMEFYVKNDIINNKNNDNNNNSINSNKNNNINIKDNKTINNKNNNIINNNKVNEDELTDANNCYSHNITNINDTNNNKKLKRFLNLFKKKKKRKPFFQPEKDYLVNFNATEESNKKYFNTESDIKQLAESTQSQFIIGSQLNKNLFDDNVIYNINDINNMIDINYNNMNDINNNIDDINNIYINEDLSQHMSKDSETIVSDYSDSLNSKINNNEDNDYYYERNFDFNKNLDSIGSNEIPRSTRCCSNRLGSISAEQSNEIENDFNIRASTVRDKNEFNFYINKFN